MPPVIASAAYDINPFVILIIVLSIVSIVFVFTAVSYFLSMREKGLKKVSEITSKLETEQQKNRLLVDVTTKSLMAKSSLQQAVSTGIKCFCPITFIQKLFLLLVIIIFI